MNLILFEAAELERPLPRHDRRAAHILEVLRRRVGDPFDVGVINGPRGKAVLADITGDALVLAFDWTTATPARAADPITLIIGLPRPQTARDILRDATSLGIGALHFVRTAKGEASYAQSTLWTSGEWRRHVLVGAEQAFGTRIPDVTFGNALLDTMAALPLGAARLALDNYEAPAALADLPVGSGGAHHVMAVGPERGWSVAERELLRAQQFQFVHLGPRVLRCETACIAALTLLRARLGLLR